MYGDDGGSSGDNEVMMGIMGMIGEGDYGDYGDRYENEEFLEGIEKNWG